MINVLICTQDDIPTLAQLNRMLIEDEKAENNMTILQFGNLSDSLSSDSLSVAIICASKNNYFYPLTFYSWSFKLIDYISKDSLCPHLFCS